MPRITAGCLIALALAAGACLAAGPWDPLLDALHLAPQTARLDPNRWTGGGEYRLDEFQRLWDDWQLVDPAARSWADEAMGAATSLGATLFFASAFLRISALRLPFPER